MLSKLSSRVLFIFLVSGSHFACSADETERPPVQDGGVGGPAGPGGGEGGDSGNGVDGSDTVSGKLMLFRDDTFSSEAAGLIAYAQPSQVHLFDEGIRAFESFDYDGATFEATDVEARAGTWFAVQPKNDATTLMTLTRHDASQTGLQLPLVQRSVLEEILGGLANPATISSTSAQLIVHLVDRAGEPIGQARPQVIGGPNMAYLASGFWTDSDDETSDDGMFLSYNIPSSSLPGQTVKLIISGSVSSEFTVPIAAGAVTVATLIAGP